MLKRNFPIRETIFGLEDGIVSTLGVLIGIAIGTKDQTLVILSGLVVIFVESLSMAAGTYLSNKSQQEVSLALAKKSPLNYFFRRHHAKLPFKESAFMGVSYVIGGIISLISFILLPIQVAVIAAIFTSFIFLFVIGFVKGKIANINPTKSGLEMVLISASASLVGYLVGKLTPSILNQL